MIYTRAWGPVRGSVVLGAVLIYSIVPVWVGAYTQNRLGGRQVVEMRLACAHAASEPGSLAPYQPEHPSFLDPV